MKTNLIIIIFGVSKNYRGKAMISIKILCRKTYYSNICVLSKFQNKLKLKLVSVRLLRVLLVSLQFGFLQSFEQLSFVMLNSILRSSQKV